MPGLFFLWQRQGGCAVVRVYGLVGRGIGRIRRRAARQRHGVGGDFFHRLGAARYAAVLRRFIFRGISPPGPRPTSVWIVGRRRFRAAHTRRL